ncbi:MAG TPA: TetR/AcrR family transcriptional regulator [Gaiellales bacterium]|jgi:AcrR family transcriptional regulator|nr:TetR/AcrR family transcriptional regulator [Gaiellales bacterium]
MKTRGNDRRTYNSPRREQQAAATRAQILASAQRLFERDGYPATSMAAVAADAGVALKTVYVAFATKSGLLRAVWHRALRGDGDDIPVGDQPWFRRVLDEPDPLTQLQLNAQNSREVKQRAGPIMEVIRAAAPGDAEIGALWRRIETEFHANQLQVIESLHRKHALRKGLGVATAADILWALNHPGVYQSLVGDREWSPARYERWLTGILTSQLLAGAERSAPQE